jgi:hypothetical protein
MPPSMAAAAGQHGRGARSAAVAHVVLPPLATIMLEYKDEIKKPPGEKDMPMKETYSGNRWRVTPWPMCWQAGAAAA